MAFGLHVLAADCQSGPHEILSSSQMQGEANYGILLPVLANRYYSAEEKIWRSSLKEMLSNKRMQEKYSEKAKEKAADFNPQRIAAQWKEVFNRLRDA